MFLVQGNNGKLLIQVSPYRQKDAHQFVLSEVPLTSTCFSIPYRLGVLHILHKMHHNCLVNQKFHKKHSHNHKYNCTRLPGDRAMVKVNFLLVLG